MKKRVKVQVREKFPRLKIFVVLYNSRITIKIMCPRGEIGRHKGLKTLGIQQ